MLTIPTRSTVPYFDKAAEEAEILNGRIVGWDLAYLQLAQETAWTSGDKDFRRFILERLVLLATTDKLKYGGCIGIGWLVVDGEDILPCTL